MWIVEIKIDGNLIVLFNNLFRTPVLELALLITLFHIYVIYVIFYRTIMRWLHLQEITVNLCRI